MAKDNKKSEFDPMDEQVKRFIETVQPLCEATGQDFWEWYLENGPDGEPQNVVTGYTYDGFNSLYLGAMGIRWTITEGQLTKIKDKIVGLPADLPTDLYKLPKAEQIRIRTLRKTEYAKYEQTTGNKLPSPKRYPLKRNGKQQYHKDGTPIMVPNTYMVTFWKTYTPKDKDGNPKLDENGKEIVKWTRKFYDVYNAEEIENYDFGISKDAPKKVFKDNEEAERLFNAYITGTGITLTHSQTYQASYYSPSRDMISLSNKEIYKNEQFYYAVFAHEGIHSTGTAERMNRAEIVKPHTFGSDPYSWEEITAESGSMFWMKKLGIKGVFNNSIAYIKHWWANVAKEPKKFIKAINDGYKAFLYMLSFGEPQENKDAA